MKSKYCRIFQDFCLLKFVVDWNTAVDYNDVVEESAYSRAVLLIISEGKDL